MSPKMGISNILKDTDLSVHENFASRTARVFNLAIQMVSHNIETAGVEQSADLAGRYDLSGDVWLCTNAISS